MEPLARLTDPPTENLGKPKSRRRWWLSFGLTVLGVSVATLTLLLSKPQTASYRFLKDAELSNFTESISEDARGLLEHHQQNRYLIRASYKECERQAESELERLGFKVIMRLDGNIAMVSEKVDLAGRPITKLIYLSEESKCVLVLGFESRPATVFDRARLWLKSLSRSRSPEPALGTPFDLP